MTDRKRPGVAFWATVVVAIAVVGYPLSFGPAVWLFDRDLLPRQCEPAIVAIYRPMIWMNMESGWRLGHLIQWYAELWMT